MGENTLLEAMEKLNLSAAKKRDLMWAVRHHDRPVFKSALKKLDKEAKRLSFGLTKITKEGLFRPFQSQVLHYDKMLRGDETPYDAGMEPRSKNILERMRRDLKEEIVGFDKMTEKEWLACIQEALFVNLEKDAQTDNKNAERFRKEDEALGEHGSLTRWLKVNFPSW